MFGDLRVKITTGGFRRGPKRRCDNLRDGKTAKIPQSSGLTFNHMQWVPEACLKGYDGDGYLAPRILTRGFEITHAFDVLAIDGECWTAANSRQWNLRRDTSSKLVDWP